jgi:hypothetical protein
MLPDKRATRVRIVVACCLAGVLAGCAVPGPAPVGLEFIDHGNLRQLEPDPAGLAREVAAVKANIDRGQAYGVSSYVLFSRGFEDLLTYDFAAGPLANVGQAAFADPAARAAKAALYLGALREIADYAHQRGVRLVLNTNQLSFPEEVTSVVQPYLAGHGAPCVDGPFLWDLYRRKMAAFWRAAPFMDGLQLTSDEADMSVTECVGPDGQAVDPDAITGRLVAETAAAAATARAGSPGTAEPPPEVQVRAWGRLNDLAGGSAFATAVAALPENVAVSIKNTEGDFLPGAPPSRLLEHLGPNVIVEFDAWGEFSGWNAFPAYLGDAYAQRIRQIAAGDGQRVAARLNWNTLVNPIFDIPYGNVVNLDVLAGLARDPAADPDVLLRDWIARTYPKGARAAAFDLYKASPNLMVRFFSPDGIDLTDHGRVFRGRQSLDQRERILSMLAYAQSVGSLGEPSAFEARRQSVDQANRDGERLVDALGDGVPPEWRAGMRSGLRNLWRVARLTTDQLELAYWSRQSEAGQQVDARAVAGAVQRIRDGAAAWVAEDPQSFERLNGPELLPSLSAFGFDTP